MSAAEPLDRYLSPAVRSTIEQRYYARINAQSRLGEALQDPAFLSNLSGHVTLFADHGVVHVRDTARQIVQVLSVLNGVLFPARTPGDLEWMMSYGVGAAYVHDIGMTDFSAFGRAMHPEYATQIVLSPEFDDVLEAVRADADQPFIRRLWSLAEAGALAQKPCLVVREMLAMANCHSKSKVPVRVLNDYPELRCVMQAAALSDRQYVYRQHAVQQAGQAVKVAQQQQRDPAEIARLVAALREAEMSFELVRHTGPVSWSMQDALRRLYDDFDREAFAWLVNPHPAVQQLVRDVVDTLRALRCADALRQRGAVLKTSGEYEVFVDQHTANAIYALRHDDDRLFLLEISEYLSAGEANIASSEVGRDGNLRISFHRGRFGTPGTTERAAYCAALVVNDIQTDVLDSFQRAAGSAGPEESCLKTAAGIQILLENVDDNVEFAELVQRQLQHINPSAARRIRTVPSLQNTSELERARYLAAGELEWDVAQRCAALERIAASGHKTRAMDALEGFRDVKLIELQAGEVLLEAGAPAGFVYIPLDAGLQVVPLGGYQPFFVTAWMPLGVTGVIRGAPRNATVIAAQPLALLMIPKDVYLKRWHHTYSPQEFGELFRPGESEPGN
jgi:hypothetical protein